MDRCEDCKDLFELKYLRRCLDKNFRCKECIDNLRKNAMEAD